MTERIKWLAIALGIAGSLLTLVIRGPKEAASFFAGAALSLVNLHSWTRLTTAVTGPAKPKVGVTAVMFTLRYLMIGGALYVIVKVLGISPVAMVLGLLVSFAAVVLGI